MFVCFLFAQVAFLLSYSRLNSIQHMRLVTYLYWI